MGILGGNRREKEFEKEMDMQEPYQESDDNSINQDLSRGQLNNLPSSSIPEDFYQYKRFINLPESQAEFETKIDKDVVFANLGGNKPGREELRFQIGTIELFEGMFVIPHKIPVLDENGEQFVDENGQKVWRIVNVFDEEFRDSLNFLKAEYKFDIVSSRALWGNDRAAYLDISTSNRISKELSRKKEQKNQLFGAGGN